MEKKGGKSCGRASRASLKLSCDTERLPPGKSDVLGCRVNWQDSWGRCRNLSRLYFEAGLLQRQLDLGVSCKARESASALS